MGGGYMKREEKINLEKEKLMTVFKEIDANKLEFVSNQIDDLAWLIVSCDELKEKINNTGTVIKYDNGGGQSGFKSNPDVRTLMSYQKSKMAITKQLIELVPVNKKAKLQEFMNG